MTPTEKKRNDEAIFTFKADVSRRLDRLLSGGEGYVRDRGDVLLLAYLITMRDRSSLHGDAVEQSDSIAQMWQQFVTEKNSDVSERQHLAGQGQKLSASDACLMMVQLKISRYIHGGHNVDNFVDICGYAAMAAECVMDRR